MELTDYDQAELVTISKTQLAGYLAHIEFLEEQNENLKHNVDALSILLKRTANGVKLLCDSLNGLHD